MMGYRFPKSTMDQLLQKEKILFGSDHQKIIELKVYAKDYLGKLQGLEILDGRLGSYDMTSLFDNYKNIFNNPKPVALIKKYFSYVIKDEGDTILDFFAGSGTTGDAVMQLNAEDGGKRKYILAQLDEQIDEKKEAYKFCQENSFEPVISSITIERLNRAGEKIKADIQAEFDAENSKKKSNQEKLVELRERYIRVFGYEPRDPRVKHEDDLLSTVIPDSDPESPNLSEEMLNQENSPSVKGWQSQTDGVVLEGNHPTDKVGTPPAEGNSALDIGYKVFSLKDKPCIKEVVKDGGQVEFVPQNLRKATIDTLANMLCATCKPLHAKIEMLIVDKLYKADNEIYLLAPVDKAELDKYKDLKINVDGYSDLDLEHFLNLGVADKDVSVVY
ncbi:MAG: adenine-specific DNA-methyltransferase [Francisella sp.]|jgi:adenine-specific DNA-methyltransferase